MHASRFQRLCASTSAPPPKRILGVVMKEKGTDAQVYLFCHISDGVSGQLSDKKLRNEVSHFMRRLNTLTSRQTQLWGGEVGTPTFWANVTSLSHTTGLIPATGTLGYGGRRRYWPLVH